MSADTTNMLTDAEVRVAYAEHDKTHSLVSSAWSFEAGARWAESAVIARMSEQAGQPVAHPLQDAVEEFLHAYKAKYRNTGNSGFRSNAPMYDAVVALNAVSCATRATPAAKPEGQAVPEGMVLVPVEPTTEMLKAAEAEWLKYGEEGAVYPLAQNFDRGLPRCWQLELSRATHVYRAMLAAAQQGGR